MGVCCSPKASQRATAPGLRSSITSTHPRHRRYKPGPPGGLGLLLRLLASCSQVNTTSSLWVCSPGRPSAVPAPPLRTGDSPSRVQRVPGVSAGKVQIDKAKSLHVRCTRDLMKEMATLSNICNKMWLGTNRCVKRIRSNNMPLSLFSGLGTP